MNATKARYGSEELATLFEGASKVFAARGKKVSEVKLDGSDAALDELRSIVLGPTGNLRAPALRLGKTWVVGFNEELYAERV